MVGVEHKDVTKSVKPVSNGEEVVRETGDGVKGIFQVSEAKQVTVGVSGVK